MSDDETLIEQLRDCADRLWGADKRRVGQAADTLTHLREENARQAEEIERLKAREDQLLNAMPKVARLAISHVAEPMTLIDAMLIAQSGFNAWAAKEHNKRWFRKIDGTPIPNDLVVNIAEAFVQADARAALTQEPTEPVPPGRWREPEDDQMDDSNWFEDPDMGAR